MGLAPVPHFATTLHANKPYYPGLSGLRGLAVLWVLAAHYAHLQILPFPTDYIGKAGVWIFFALSAYLLTSGLTAALGTTRTAWRPVLAFAIHRFFRIYPLFLCCLLYHHLRSDMALPVLWQHLCLQAGWRELWAIPVEFRYYLCIPLLCFLAVRFRFWPGPGKAGIPVAALLSLATLWMALQPEQVFANSTALAPKLFPFACGSFLALYQGKFLAWWQLRGKVAALHHLISISALLALVLITVNYRSLTVSNLESGCSPLISLGLSLCATALLFLALAAPLARWFFSLPPLVFAGKISFSLYLWHWPVLTELSAHGIHAGNHAYSVPVLAFFLAWLSYRFIERPGIAAGRMLSAWLSCKA